MKLLVFLPKHVPTPVKPWIAGLKNHLDKRRLDVEIQFFSYPVRTDLILFLGDPLIIVGARSRVLKIASSLRERNEDLFLDHAYFWILSDFDDDELRLNMPDLNEDRVVALNWHNPYYNIVAHELESMSGSPQLVGCSRALRTIRSEIRRIATEKVGPWTPVLILGESGVGKTEVARALFEASDRFTSNPKAFEEVPCGWFHAETLHSQLFGHAQGAYTGAVRAKTGLLEKYSDGALLLDDFDTAPLRVQEALLSILSTRRGHSAVFEQLGGTSPHHTDVWLIFATNADVGQLLAEGKIREDFIFRFENRVTYIPALKARPADLPALIKQIQHETLSEGLITPVAVDWLLQQGLSWTGNVRAVRTLIALATSQIRRTKQAAIRVLSTILNRGPASHHWVGIFATPLDPPDTGTVVVSPSKAGKVDEIIALDVKDCVRGRGPEWPSTGSEIRAHELLRTLPIEFEAERRFAAALQDSHARSTRNTIRHSVRLSRILCLLCMSADHRINRGIGQSLCGVSATTIDGDCELLVRHRLLSPVTDSLNRKTGWILTTGLG